MTTEIEIEAEGLSIPFALDWARWRWRSSEE